MADPGVVAVASVGVALTKVLLRACNYSSGADLVGDSQEFVGTLSRVLHRTGESKGQIERHVSQALAASTEAMRERCIDQGVDPDLLSGACTEVEIILEEIADDGEFLLSAVRSPEAFPEILRERAAQRRMKVESAAEPYFDELLQAVATEYSALAPYSPRFQIEAFKSILSGIDEIQECSRRSLDAHAVTHDKLDTLSSKFDMMTCPTNTPNRILFGSRPDVVVGDRFVERAEQEQLEALITDPKRQRTVLVGMRGSGKTQLAAALAKQCEDANWSLIAWVNAVSPESIKSALVELAKQLQIDTSDQPAQDVIIRRCLDHLKSADPADRLIVFDNVEDINHLRGLMPSGNGLRVVATTTNNTGWEHQDWNRIKVGEFDRRESIDYLLTVTNSDDREAADALADRLGDLPLAIAQAAATARHKELSLPQYLKRLESHRKEHAIHPVPGDDYTVDVATALWMATEDALDSMKNGTKEMAQHQLGALALLAESGVPTRWLDPTSAQGGDEESQGAEHSTDEEAHDALTELIHRSIVQQSADGTTTMLHSLQAQAFRESWNASEAAEACRSAVILLGRVKIDSISRTNTYFRRQETLALIEQLGAIGEQIYSQHLLASTQVRFALNHALTQAYDLDLSHEGITLSRTVLLVVERFAPDTEYILTLYNNLAVVYHCAGYLDVAITLYEDNLKRSIDFHGAEHFETLYKHSNLLYAYRTAGRLAEAIAQSEQLIKVSTKVLGTDAPLVLTLRNNLASCYELDGQLDRAINLYEQVLDDHVRVLGSDDPNTLATRNNLASAYQSDGRLDDAIRQYTEVLAIGTSILGEYDTHTLTWRTNLAYALQIAGRIDEAISQFAKLVAGYSRILGAEHPDTLAARNNLANSYALAGNFPEAIKQWEIIYADAKRLLGEAHPFTATVRDNLEAARRQLAEQVDSCPSEEREEEH
jgi:hypothetical protein avisC_02045